MWKWETEGEAKGVMVIVHGAMEHHGRYTWLIEKWQEAGFHVIMGDLPGQGTTSRSGRGHIQSFDQYIDAIYDWLQHAYEYHLPVFLLGHSMGGLATTRLLQTKEKEQLHIAGVILSSPCFGLAYTPTKFKSAISKGLNLVTPKFKLESGISTDLSTRNEEVKNAEENDSLYITKVSIRWYRELIGAMKNAFEDVAEMKDFPLCVMQAGDDKIVDLQKVYEWVHQVSLSEKHWKVWPGLYHEIFSEPERDLVFTYARDFTFSRLRQLGFYIE
ncbi:alpha/beta hydrolase [Bacillus fonticola]|uniref:alpha/beta hydrolase n=1 Tax=Bacillus fonticola TaxID=2728853 RepID=UPI001472A026|nr:alpha/beta hydrolase [Bacillus fonticola]